MTIPGVTALLGLRVHLPELRDTPGVLLHKLPFHRPAKVLLQQGPVSAAGQQPGKQVHVAAHLSQISIRHQGVHEPHD